MTVTRVHSESVIFPNHSYVVTYKENGDYRSAIGPFVDYDDAKKTANRLKSNTYHSKIPTVEMGKYIQERLFRKIH